MPITSIEVCRLPRVLPHFLPLRWVPMSPFVAAVVLLAARSVAATGGVAFAAGLQCRLCTTRSRWTAATATASGTWSFAGRHCRRWQVEPGNL